MISATKIYTPPKLFASSTLLSSIASPCARNASAPDSAVGASVSNFGYKWGDEKGEGRGKEEKDKTGRLRGTKKHTCLVCSLAQMLRTLPPHRRGIAQVRKGHHAHRFELDGYPYMGIEREDRREADRAAEREVEKRNLYELFDFGSRLIGALLLEWRDLCIDIYS